MGKYIFANKLMFAIIMRDPVACQRFLEMIFPRRKVKKIFFPERAGEGVRHETMTKLAAEVEKTIITGIASKSVRLDVLFEGDDTVYDLEMQLEAENEIAKRSRYYHMAIARNSLKRGESYSKLKRGYVIFVCCFDPFNMDEPLYQFEMFDRKLQLQLDDGSSTIILNTKCSKGKIPEEFAAFYNFVNTGNVDEKNELVRYLGKRVKEANEDEEVDRIMTLDEEMRLQWERAIEQGKELGKELGLELGKELGLEQGKELGLEQGKKLGLELGKELGLEQGKELGLEQGKKLGLEQGKEEGRIEEKYTIAKKCLKLGIPVDVIAESTGLSPEEIKEL